MLRLILFLSFPLLAQVAPAQNSIILFSDDPTFFNKTIMRSLETLEDTLALQKFDTVINLNSLLRNDENALLLEDTYFKIKEEKNINYDLLSEHKQLDSNVITKLLKHDYFLFVSNNVLENYIEVQFELFSEKEQGINSRSIDFIVSFSNRNIKNIIENNVKSLFDDCNYYPTILRKINGANSAIDTIVSSTIDTLKIDYSLSYDKDNRKEDLRYYWRQLPIDETGYIPNSLSMTQDSTINFFYGIANGIYKIEVELTDPTNRKTKDVFFIKVIDGVINDKFHEIEFPGLNFKPLIGEPKYINPSLSISFSSDVMKLNNKILFQVKYDGNKNDARLLSYNGILPRKIITEQYHYNSRRKTYKQENRETLIFTMRDSLPRIHKYMIYYANEKEVFDATNILIDRKQMEPWFTSAEFRIRPGASYFRVIDVNKDGNFSNITDSLRLKQGLPSINLKLNLILYKRLYLSAQFETFFSFFTFSKDEEVFFPPYAPAIGLGRYSKKGFTEIKLKRGFKRDALILIPEVSHNFDFRLRKKMRGYFGLSAAFNEKDIINAPGSALSPSISLHLGLIFVTKRSVL